MALMVTSQRCPKNVACLKASFILQLAISAILATAVGCTFVSRGKVFVSETQADCAAEMVEDEVARIVSAVAERHGLKQSWQIEPNAAAPCTLERGCIWSTAPWSFPWVSVSRTAEGRVKVEIERRDAIRDEQVRAITQTVAMALRERFGEVCVAVDIGY